MMKTIPMRGYLATGLALTFGASVLVGNASAGSDPPEGQRSFRMDAGQILQIVSMGLRLGGQNQAAGITGIISQFAGGAGQPNASPA